MSTLYIVATPIGNLKDITIRALEVLKSVDVIACEDTRKTGMLLKKMIPFIEPTKGEDLSNVLNVKTPELMSYYEQNEFRRIPEVITLLKNGCSVALVSNAGTPTISDPGFKLVRECIEQGFKVESIPGPSAVITALTVSGLPTDKFLFLGFLPKKGGHRKKLLEKAYNSVKQVKSTIIFYEAPHRLLEALQNVLEIFGSIDIVICRELTKVYEEVRRENIKNSLEYFTKTNPKGEFVVLFNLGEQIKE